MYVQPIRKYFSLGEIILGAGDSAGANLLLSCTLKCIHMGIPTCKGLFAAYVPTGVHFIPSPARMHCLMDPMLPFGFLMRCLKGIFNSKFMTITIELRLSKLIGTESHMDFKTVVILLHIKQF